ncbi:hypothetical protein PHMEG_0002050 [Phytophthora megakarya]|uniref:J domain-containing protein n=1 Tax=Phytophthora megakarya TaxID=4795 RepID=A0A225WZM1_9STRA|nr:hypothetical protein PHMEG_0002050 [Phytophthora megakarya]
MASTSAVVRPTKKHKKSGEKASKRAWWWPDTSVNSESMRIIATSETELLNAAVLCAALSATQSEPSDDDKQANDRAIRELEAVNSEPMRIIATSETELLNAAVLCAALSATQSEPSDDDKQANDRAIRELEMHVRKSPLPHSLQLPVLAFTRDYVLMQSELAVLCAVRATKPADILQTVVGSAVPLSQPYVHRFGGARIHAPFWTRTQRLDLQDIHHQARQAKKMLLLCGHSIGGSIAQLAFCELVYQHLSTKTRLFLEKQDYDKEKQESSGISSDGLDFRLMVQSLTEEERATITRSTPNMLAIGFGSPYIGSSDLTSFLEPLKLNKRVINFVNEHDCIPSILNVAQSAAMVAKTTERFVTITKATKTLVNLLPIQMQQRFVVLASTANTATVPSASSAYLSMSLNILQNTFQKFRDYNIVKEIDYQYSPCGTYIFLSKSGAGYNIYSDPSAVYKALHKEDDSNSSLTGNAILQHLMSAYVAAVARRSNSIQINASMNYYERLGVPRNATEQQIRKAYKRQAMKWHPDRQANSSNPQEQASAEEIFKLLAESYEVLSDTTQRNAYDAHLNDSPSLKDEFVRNGTVNGMTLDEAIATFRDAIDNLSGAVSKYTEMSKKNRQAEQADERKKRKDASSLAITDPSSNQDDSAAKKLFVRGAQQALVAMKQEEDAAEDKIIEEFFDCATEYDNVALEAMAEEEFFDCIDLMDDVTVYFSDEAMKKEKHTEHESNVKDEDVPLPKQVAFPSGSTVQTPFGLATVKDWREGEASAVLQFTFPEFMVGYIQKMDISRGASIAKATTSDLLESKRTKLADRVVARYRLSAGESGGTFRSLVVASGDGALDSGIRAAGGVALANGMARTSSVLGGAVAAPLTIASILVDIGKEYYDYRKRYTDRKSLGVLSTTTEQLMMRDFRLKTGEVIVSRTAAAAGAGIGAYSVASALGMWSTAGLAAGPVGIVATTSAAVVGGMLGFFAGSKAYSASTTGYFTSQQNAKEHIDRLELGARILFDEFDPGATGTISKEDCIKLMKKLYDAMGSISESGYERTMAVIQDDNFQGPVAWGMFWEWVSTEAARALRELEHEESKKLSEPVAGETWWNSYMKYFSYLNATEATPLLAGPQAAMYPSVLAALGLVVIDTTSLLEIVEAQSVEAEQESLVLKAQVEFLVNNGHLTVGDAFQLREQIASNDLVLKESARKTIAAMHEGLSDAGPDQNLVCEGFGFTGGDTIEPSSDETPENNRGGYRPHDSKLAASGTNCGDEKKTLVPDERLDVMCSLMSTQGLQRFLQRQNILVPTGDQASVQHEDLHCLALMAAPASPPTPST